MAESSCFYMFHSKIVESSCFSVSPKNGRISFYMFHSKIVESSCFYMFHPEMYHYIQLSLSVANMQSCDIWQIFMSYTIFCSNLDQTTWSLAQSRIMAVNELKNIVKAAKLSWVWLLKPTISPQVQLNEIVNAAKLQLSLAAEANNRAKSADTQFNKRHLVVSRRGCASEPPALSD